ncbi:MAG TPA: 16S rRNA (guanine(527)-N(7))-methyltransferase RsmG [Rudaea sp.]|jgi:16S rRNA (guanine527-N7)-methyltransferase|nr:16S rRNA (guanine(527)-N(7))-methyltransferase RsmG [Rudaea sp.]
MSISDRASLYARLQAGLAELGLAPGADACERLLDYVELLTRWNAAYNLTAVRAPDEMVTRHLLDSLAVAKLVRGDSLADLGTGAGLPGIPLAILAPERQHTLIDSNGKKVRFLREAVRTLGLANVQVQQSRVEDARGQYDCITARAFATLGEMLRLGGHLLAPDGIWIALKGRLSKEEILGVPAGFAVADVMVLTVPGLGAARQVAIIKRTNAQEQAA